MSLNNESHTKRLLSKAMIESNATCLDYADIQNNVSVAIWSNQQDRVLKYNKHLHTLSMYIEGGHKTYRTDKKGLVGSPDKLCFFPAGHESDWVIGQQLKLVHLYFTDCHLNYLGLTAFDKDPRTLELPDLTYESDSLISAQLYTLLERLTTMDMSNRLQLQELQQKIILSLLERYSQHSAEVIRGGLSPKVKSRIFDFIHDHLSQDITLEQLADEACMSTYHFAHMFKQSVGLSPYQFLLKQRMNLAAAELRDTKTIATVGERCGYNNPSRFARTFKATFGMTPKAYQSACV